jgi:fimbrial isopeptide formation D2 family protein/uncharacterized repeat protein (TIGR01451 family)
MTNSDATSVQPQVGARRRRFGPFAKATLASLVAVLGVGLFASPAFAHTNTVVGVASCGTNTYSITWTITNTYNGKEKAKVSSTSGGLSVAKLKIKANSTGTVTQTLPPTDSGTVTLDVLGVWSSYSTPTNAPDTGVVSLPTKGCFPPSVTVTKSVSPSAVTAGSSTPVVYTLAVKNTAALTTTKRVQVTDTVPAGTAYVALSAVCGSGTGGAGEPTCNASEAGGILTFNVGKGLAAAATADVSFSVTADAGDRTGTIPNTADFTYVGCTPTKPATTCTSNTVDLTVTNNAAVTVLKSANTTAVAAGQATPVTYTLTVANPAPPATSTTISGIDVTDVVPAGLTYASASCGALLPSSTPSCAATYDASTDTVSFALGAGIAAGTSYPVTFEATVNAGDTATIDNIAGWTGPGCVPTAPATTCPTNTVPITVAGIAVTKSDSAGSGSVDPGQVVTYTLSADNIGSGPASVTVDDSVPAQTTLATPAAACPANTASTCTVTVTGSAISWVITNMPAGATYALTFAVTVDSGATGQITNTGLYTEPGCTTAGGCPTNTTTNPVTPPTSTGTPTTPAAPATTTTTDPTPAPVTGSTTGTPPAPIAGATTVHTGEPWAGSTPFVLAVLALGLSLLGLSGEIRRRRRPARAPTA